MKRSNQLFLGATLIAAICGGCAPRAAVDTTGGEPADATDLPAREWNSESPYTPILTPLASVDPMAEGAAAVYAYGFQIPTAEFEQGYQEFLAGRAASPALRSEYGAEVKDQLMILRWIAETGAMDNVTLRANARRKLRQSLAELGLESEIHPSVVSEEETRRLYDSRAASYKTEPKVDVRIILVSGAEDANDILARLKQGESFAALAGEFSQHESRSQGGQIDAFARGEYQEDFERKAFDLQPGEIGYVNTSAGFFIIQKIANIPSVEVSYEDARAALRTEILAQKQEAERAAALERIRARVQ